MAAGDDEFAEDGVFVAADGTYAVDVAAVPNGFAAGSQSDETNYRRDLEILEMDKLVVRLGDVANHSSVE